MAYSLHSMVCKGPMDPLIESRSPEPRRPKGTRVVALEAQVSKLQTEVGVLRDKLEMLVALIDGEQVEAKPKPKRDPPPRR